ncbi:putative 1-acylglycerol-3-phosphate O-acyltransferase [Nitrospina gracilis 3/211]|uniref:Putative 1-acylglycerol-3-phosphate O-acyltransferase n=1 Tax=Nitrospina gracilis (strain 3/211) TaxID=1266370 RepID=M1ZAE4_NITG3|nr:putative 1-acylglycerol-3-phosphate O-acyltransferase [Nitrospina gracilis 3/211]
MPFLRMGYRLVLITSVVILSFLTSIVLWLLFRNNQKSHCKWVGWFARFWGRRACAAIGLSYTVEGDLNIPAGSMIVANHVGAVDIFLMAANFKLFFVSKAEVNGWPVVGQMAQLGKTIFVDRSRRHQVTGMIDSIRKRMRDGFNVAWFPEGSVTKGDDVYPFKPSAFEAAVQEKRPVVPVLIRYEGGGEPYVASWTGTLGEHMIRVLKSKGLRAKVRVFPPIPPAKTRQELSRASHDLLYHAFHNNPNEKNSHVTEVGAPSEY